MILIGLGANLPSRHGSPRETLMMALRLIEAQGGRIAQVSPWYRSAPVPRSDQPWYLNAVARIETALDPSVLLGVLHSAEASLGRERRVRNEPRTVDLDLLAYGALVAPADWPGSEDSRLIVPHPRLHFRRFVLVPLSDLVPHWRHPATGRNITEMLAECPRGDELVAVPA